jgi:hypothetical protein
MAAGKATYEVEKRGWQSFAVIRRGPRGGIRTITVYDNQMAADTVRDILAGLATMER